MAIFSKNKKKEKFITIKLENKSSIFKSLSSNQDNKKWKWASQDIKRWLSCATLASLWPLVRAWIGFDGTDTQVISDHFTQFIYYTYGLKARWSFLQLVWLLCVWVLWNEHNSRLFKNQESSLYRLLEKVKLYSLWWLKAKKTNFILGTQMWWSNHLMCLNTSWAEEIALVLLI